MRRAKMRETSVHGEKWHTHKPQMYELAHATHCNILNRHISDETQLQAAQVFAHIDI